MLTIDFEFFANMREKLQEPFALSDYNPEELHILLNSADMLSNRTYCSEEFARGAESYFASQGMTPDVVLLTKELSISETAAADILKQYPTLESATQYIDSLPSTTSHGRTTVDIPARDGASISKEKEEFIKNITNLFAKRDVYLGREDLKDYYCAWLSDKPGFERYAFEHTVNQYTDIAGSKTAVNKIISSLGGMERLNNIEEIISNHLWKTDDTLNKYHAIRPELKAFFTNMMEYKGIDGLNLTFRMIESQNQMREFFNYEAGFLTIDGPESAERSYQALERRLESVDYSDINLANLSSKGFDVAAFQKLASQYNMPHDIIQKLINEDLAHMYVTDNIRSTLPGGNDKFTLAIEYQKDGRSNLKKYSVELLPKTDPSALFVGKMTKCCQFYTGHSSDQAVMPVYNDPNAGLIVVKDIKNKNKIKAASFVWIGQDENGQQALVLDSFEHLHEADKAFIPFIEALSHKLSESDTALYLGAGGKTPKLHINQEDDILAEVAATSRPAALSAGFMPYADSSKVYLIRPGAHYSAVTSAAEGDPLALVTNNLSAEGRESLKDIFPKFVDFELDKIAEYCIKKNCDFGAALKKAEPFSGELNFFYECNALMEIGLALSNDKTALLNQYPRFNKLLNKYGFLRSEDKIKKLGQFLEQDITKDEIEAILERSFTLEPNSYFSLDDMNAIITQHRYELEEAKLQHYHDSESKGGEISESEKECNGNIYINFTTPEESTITGEVTDFSNT